MEMENNRQTEEENPPEPYVLVIHSTHEAVFVKFLGGSAPFDLYKRSVPLQVAISLILLLIGLTTL